MIKKSIIRIIKNYSVNADWELAFGGKAKGNRHLFRVAKIAKYLAKKENAKMDIVEAGAWLHDIGLIKGNDNVPQEIRAIAENFLQKLNLSVEEQNFIADCVESHEGLVLAKTLEAKLVHDADVLDKSGVLGVIRHTWKITNLIDPQARPDKIYDILKEHLFWRKSKLYTPTAKKIANTMQKQLSVFMDNKKQAIVVIEFINKLAYKGYTTEKIARRLIKNKRINKSFSNLLSNQIVCGYLK